MDYRFDALEARVLGCLLEKQVSTPDQYPLSLNSIVTACNQKSNREPVLELSEEEAFVILEGLKQKRLVHEESGHRVAKYQQRFCNLEFGKLHFSAAELAIVTELLLRGPQTPGELRARCARLHVFSQVTEVEQALKNLVDKGPYVEKLPREAGKRENRFVHLFQDEALIEPLRTSFPKRVDARPVSFDLEARVSYLERQLASVMLQLGIEPQRSDD